jgi:RimJ/RimL family protein N-acetyltransferase
MSLDFSSEIQLENDRVRLEPLQKSHFSELEKISEDQAIWGYFFERGDTKEALKEYIQNALQQRASNLEYPFVVWDKSKNSIAGMTRMYAYSKTLQTIKLGHTWYGKAFRGTGVNKHCKYLLFEFLFEQCKIERIGFGVYDGNEISVAALKSVGCQHEGILRAMFPALEGTGRADALLFSILKTNWEENVKQELKKKLK